MSYKVKITCSDSKGCEFLVANTTITYTAPPSDLSTAEQRAVNQILTSIVPLLQGVGITKLEIEKE